MGIAVENYMCFSKLPLGLLLVLLRREEPCVLALSALAQCYLLLRVVGPAQILLSAPALCCLYIYSPRFSVRQGFATHPSLKFPDSVPTL